MDRPQILKKLKRKIWLTSLTKPLHSHMTARTSFLRLQRTSNHSRRESPHFSQSQKKPLMLTKLRASLETNLLFATSALITTTKLQLNNTKTMQVLSTWLIKGKTRRSSKRLTDNRLNNKPRKNSVINTRPSVNATSSRKWPSRWRMGSMSIQWCPMVCLTSTNAHPTSFKWCTSTISRWWSTIRWTRWMKAWRVWASHLLSFLHLKERAQTAVTKKHQLDKVNNINQDAKNPSNSQETSSQWCSQACNQWARTDLAKKPTVLPTWVERASSQASLLPFKEKDVKTLWVVLDHSIFQERGLQWFNSAQIIKKTRCHTILSKLASWESTMKCQREAFSMPHLRN